MNVPFPHKTYPDVTHITRRELDALGVRTLLLDLDGTLMRSGSTDMRADIAEWIRELSKTGTVIFLLSNNRSPERVRAVAERFGLPWTWHAGKPRRSALDAVRQELAPEPDSTAVVGDQIFTDMLLARRCGVMGLLVESMDDHRWYYRLRLLAERPFRRAKRQGRTEDGNDGI